MEFFELFSTAYAFTELFHPNFAWKDLWISLGVGGGLFLICLIFGGVGLYTMAKRRGMKCPWLGFLPFANTYYAGQIAGEANFFGQKMKRHGLYAMLAEIVYVIVMAFSLTTSIFLRNPAYWEEVYNANQVLTGYKFNSSLVPAEYQWIVSANMWLEILSYLFNIVMLIFMWVVYFAVFRKYYMRSPFMMTFLSIILPFRGVVLFAVRKNAPVDYNAVMKKRMEELYRAQNPNYNPSGPFSEIGGGEGRAEGGGGDSPFSEFDGSSADHKNE